MQPGHERDQVESTVYFYRTSTDGTQFVLFDGLFQLPGRNAEHAAGFGDAERRVEVVFVTDVAQQLDRIALLVMDDHQVAERLVPDQFVLVLFCHNRSVLKLFVRSKFTQIGLHLGDEVVAPSAGLEPDEFARVVQPAQLPGTDVQHLSHVQIIQYGVFEFGSRRIFCVRELADVFTQQVHLLIDGLAGLLDLLVKFYEVHIVISFLSSSAKVKKATRLIVILELNFNRKNCRLWNQPPAG